MLQCVPGMEFNMEACLGILAGYVWGLPLICLLVGTGLYFTIRLGFLQFRGFAHSIRVIRGDYDDPNDPGEISHFKALCTALSATVGLGNIAGVAVAVNLGGPGAVFWMIVVGVLGMITKYAECTLSVMYRKIDSQGRVRGGPMYYIEKGLGSRWLAIFFAAACVSATLGAGNMFQSNQVATIMEANFGVPKLAIGILLTILTGVVIIGGIRRVGRITSILVPLMGLTYCLAGLLVMVLHWEAIPSMVGAIVSDAFTGTSAVGGFTGVAVAQVIRHGVARACFSNEAGLGSAAIAHAAACTKEPAREGFVALLGPFIDTIVVCSITAFVILSSGVPWHEVTGIELTARAFDQALPGFGTYFITFSTFLFAYSTLLSWSYYGEQATEYLLGPKAILAYQVLFCLLIAVGAIWKLGAILNFSDVMLGLMVVPNLIAVFFLREKVFVATKAYMKKYNV